MPEIIFSRVSTLVAVNVTSQTALWSVATTDVSGSAASVAFDFNGDGTIEVVHRDATQLRVLYGGPLASAPAEVMTGTRNYATFSCTSPTMNEGPAIADIDGDGHADVLAICGAVGNAALRTFRSDSWRPARPLWNQAMFVAGMVDDAGNVYRHEQARTSIVPPLSGARPLNGALVQLAPGDLYEGGDLERLVDVTASALTVRATADCGGIGNQLDVTMTVSNAGAAPVPGNLKVTLHAGEPGAATSIETFSLMDGTFVSGSLPIAPGADARVRFRIAEPSVSAEIFVVLNDDSGTATPALGVPECDGNDNTVTAGACAECASDTECGGDTSRCHVETARCVECVETGDCDDANQCTDDACVDGACESTPSVEAKPCAGGGVCDGTGSAECVECLTDAQCSGAKSRCDTAARACVECLDVADCDSSNECASAVCTTGQCAVSSRPAGASCSSGVCSGDATDPACLHCMDSATGTGSDAGCSQQLPACDESAAQPTCEVCVVVADGPTDDGCSAETPRCDAAGSPRTCVQCLADDDCAGSLRCEPASRRCVECLVDDDCADGRACDDVHACVETSGAGDGGTGGAGRDGGAGSSGGASGGGEDAGEGGRGGDDGAKSRRGGGGCSITLARASQPVPVAVVSLWLTLATGILRRRFRGHRDQRDT